MPAVYCQHLTEIARDCQSLYWIRCRKMLEQEIEQIRIYNTLHNQIKIQIYNCRFKTIVLFLYNNFPLEHIYEVFKSQFLVAKIFW